MFVHCVPYLRNVQHGKYFIVDDSTFEAVHLSIDELKEDCINIEKVNGIVSHFEPTLHEFDENVIDKNKRLSFVDNTVSRFSVSLDGREFLDIDYIYEGTIVVNKDIEIPIECNLIYIVYLAKAFDGYVMRLCALSTEEHWFSILFDENLNIKSVWTADYAFATDRSIALKTDTILKY